LVGDVTPDLGHAFLAQIVDNDWAAVEALAVALGRKFGQRWVGMSNGARFTSIPASKA
jgi:hypothetical protein